MKYKKCLLLGACTFMVHILMISQNQIAPKSTEQWVVNKTYGDYHNAAIDVTEGTWMNVDVSPNGKHLVFDMLGDIYMMDFSGREPTRLTSDVPWQMQPKFSPDGQSIAFISDEAGGENIWIMDVNGENKRALTNEEFRMINSPSWSPDGKFLIVRKHFTNTRSLGAGEIWRYDTSQGIGEQLVPRPNDQKDMGEPAYSANGNHIYFSQDVTPGDMFEYSKDSEKGIYAIKRLEISTGKIEIILSGRGGAIRPTPSPDGTKLAYITRRDFKSHLYIHDLISGENFPIYKEMDRDKQEAWAIHGVYPSMSWIPDSKNIVFWAGGKINNLQLASKEVKAIEFHIRTSKKMSDALRFAKNIDLEQFDVKMIRNVEISPNGKKVIYEALGHIYIKELPNGQPKRLTTQTSHFEFDPSFSRDGKKIVYSVWNDMRQGGLIVHDIENHKETQVLNEPGKYIEASFSPNGKSIVYRKLKEDHIVSPKWSLNSGIYTVNLEGGEPVKIVDHGRMPHFANRNDIIYFQSVAEYPQLSKVDINIFEPVVLYTSKYATEFKMSPDEKSLAFVSHYKVYSTPFIENGEAIQLDLDLNNPAIYPISQDAGNNLSFDSAGKIYWNHGAELYEREVNLPLNRPILNEKNKNIKSTPIGFDAKIEKPNGIIAFVGGKVVTMENDEIFENGTVIVEGNHIKEIGDKDKVSIPKNAKIIDISGKTIIPGLIDTHAHGAQGFDEIIPQQNWLNYATLALGVTTIFNPNTNTSHIFATSEMQKAGRIVSPRIFSTGKSLYGAYEVGHTAIINSLDDARFHVKRLKKVGAFAIKMHHQPRREQYQQIIQAARENEMMVLSEGGALLQQDLGKIVDGASSIEHSMALANVYEDIYQFWSQSTAAYVPTLVVSFGGISGENYWYDKTEVWKHPLLKKYVPQSILASRSMRRTTAPEHHYNHFNVVKIAKKLRDKGVMVGIGGHGQREGLAAHWEMWMLGQGGMSPYEALQSATIIPAKHLGLDKNIGSIKAGKLADLTIIDGDVLSNIRISDKVIYVMINGRLYDSNTMNEIGNFDKIRQPFYFEESFD